MPPKPTNMALAKCQAPSRFFNPLLYLYPNYLFILSMPIISSSNFKKFTKKNPKNSHFSQLPGAARGEDHLVTPHRAPPAIPTAKTTPGSSCSPHLPNHGLGQHFCSPWAAQHVSCLQEDLGTVLHRFQVPFLPRCQGSVNGFVNELLRRQRGKGSKEDPPQAPLQVPLQAPLQVPLQVPLHHQVTGKSEGLPTPGTNHRCHHNPESAAAAVGLFQDPWGLEGLLEPPSPQNAFHFLNPGQALLLPPNPSQEEEGQRGALTLLA